MNHQTGTHPLKFHIYQLFVRLFGNAKAQTVSNGTIKENGCGKFNDLNEDALKSIRELGMDAIWLTGIVRHATQTDYSKDGFPASHPATVKGKAGSPYAINDYFELDPDLATTPGKRWKEFEECVQRIHQAGMNVILDFVPNHTARQYSSPTAKQRMQRDLGEQDFTHETFHPNNHYYYFPEQPLQLPDTRTDSKGNPYFEFPAKATGNDCFSAQPSVNDWYETVKLNYGRHYGIHQDFFNPIPATWHYMNEVLSFWAEKGVDGFRCDMVELVPVEFWAWIIPQLKSRFPALLFIGEVYNPELYRTFIENGKFDFLYDKVGLYDTVRELVEGKGDTNRITQVWQGLEGIEDHMLRFLENHDEQRIASDFVGKDAFRAIPALVVSCLMHKGPVMLYAGQELGEKAEGPSGFSGDDGKTTIFDYDVVATLRSWNNDGNWNTEKLTESQVRLRNEYAQLMHFSKESDTIRQGSFYDLQYSNQNHGQYNPHKIFSFLRYLPSERLLIICSFEEKDQWIRLVIPPEAWNSLGIETQKRCLLEDAVPSGEPIEFYVRSSFNSDGGTAGILIPIKAFGYRIFRITTL
jgi:glycosidase